MPVHDFKCQHCLREFERYQSQLELKDFETCIFCDGKAKKVFRSSRLSMFREGYYEIDDPGKDPYISSMSQLRDECKKRGLVSRYVEDCGTRIKVTK